MFRRKLMKRISFIAIAACLMTAFFAGQVFADAYDVTASFGVRVTEKGTSEKVGEITIQGQTDTDLFSATQIITVELLGKATISRSFAASYAYGGGNYIDLVTDEEDVADIVPGTTPAVGAEDYRIVAVKGQDFFTIEVFVNSIAGEQIRVGHQELAVVGPPAIPAGQYSALCFNLEDTIYNADDPAQQLVQVSYADSESNTFSGDIYVATVKAATVVVDACSKTLAQISLDYTESQDLDCGQGSEGHVCLFTFEDTATGALTGEYSFRVGKTDGAKAGIGIAALYVQKSSDGGSTWSSLAGVADAYTDVTLSAWWNRSGDEIELADFETDDYYSDAEYLALNSSQVEGTVVLTGTGANVVYRLLADVRYDTCVATVGNWVIDAFANRVPCGGSFSVTDWTAAAVVAEGGTTQKAVFPYAAGLGAGWYNGISFYNPNSTALTISCAIKEADGDAYVATVDVPAGEMKVGLVGALLSPTTTGTDAAFGDENYNITATADGLFYGFLFITNGTVAQGYLPIMDPTLEHR